MEKGIIVGVTQELMLRKSLGFLMSRNITSVSKFTAFSLLFKTKQASTLRATSFYITSCVST